MAGSTKKTKKVEMYQKGSILLIVELAEIDRNCQNDRDGPKIA